MNDKTDQSYDDVPQAADFSEVEDPFALFEDWMALARQREPNDPNAMALATVDADGLPNLRMVLLKEANAQGFVFFSNQESAKGSELAANPKAALCFHWKSLRRQVRVRGPVETVESEEADAYFATRPKGSRIGAWASKQSRALESQMALEKAVAKFTLKFGLGDIPRPPYWSGYRILPLEMEFWHDRSFRLHDRVVFKRARAGETWSKARLYP
jgi:pyridoxamine 5'-phosphate oxidase